MEVWGNNRSVMPLDNLGRTRATLTKTASIHLGRKVWVIFKTLSWWGLSIAIIGHERGIPSKCKSSACVDYVPALCTHRPSLLPIERLSETSGLSCRSFTALTFREVGQTWSFRGSKSRNKVTVGEPAVGSLMNFGWVALLPSIVNTLWIVKLYLASDAAARCRIFPRLSLFSLGKGREGKAEKLVPIILWTI